MMVMVMAEDSTMVVAKGKLWMMVKVMTGDHEMVEKMVKVMLGRLRW